MVDGYAVNGPAIVFTGTGGGGALLELGYTDQGVDIEILENKLEIITDLLGPMTPQDWQEMGMLARIVCPLIAMDRSVLATVTGRSDRVALGEIGSPGLVLGMNGFAFRVGIASLYDVPWSFTTCLLRPRFGTRLATKANPFRVEFIAWPFVPVSYTYAGNAPLWTRSLV